MKRIDALDEAEVIEDIVQPLTAVLARVSVLQEQVRQGEVHDLDAQLAALRASAERLADRIGGIGSHLAT